MTVIACILSLFVLFLVSYHVSVLIGIIAMVIAYPIVTGIIEEITRCKGRMWKWRKWNK